MRIGLDIDNVIADFDKKILEEFYKEDRNKRNSGIINPKGDWIKNCFDWSNEEIEDFFIRNMREFAKDLILREDTKKYMDKMLEDGHELYLISHRAYPHYTNPYEITKEWLNEKDINYTELILSKSTDKSPECKDYSIDIMFDDSQSNCHKLNAGGVNCYLMATNYNINDRDGLKVVNNWNELYEVINNYE